MRRAEARYLPEPPTPHRGYRERPGGLCSGGCDRECAPAILLPVAPLLAVRPRRVGAPGAGSYRATAAQTPCGSGQAVSAWTTGREGVPAAPWAQPPRGCGPFHQTAVGLRGCKGRPLPIVQPPVLAHGAWVSSEWMEGCGPGSRPGARWGWVLCPGDEACHSCAHGGLCGRASGRTLSRGRSQRVSWAEGRLWPRPEAVGELRDSGQLDCSVGIESRASEWAGGARGPVWANRGGRDAGDTVGPRLLDGAVPKVAL